MPGYRKLHKFIRRAGAGLLALVMVLGMIFAQPLASYAEETGSITVNFPVDGTSFSLYQVGKLVGGDPVLTGVYAESGIDLDSSDAAMNLQVYTVQNEVAADAVQVTADGKATFANLAVGVYLVIGETAKDGKTTYTPAAVLASVPQWIDHELVYDVAIENKYSEETDKTTEVSVLKIWNDGTNKYGYRPKSVKAVLIRNGQVIDTVQLSKANNWSYTWKDLDADATYVVAEKRVPSGYVVSYSKIRKTWIIKNTVIPPGTPDVPPTQESSSVPESSSPEESTSVPESSTEESSVPESSTEESSSVPESSTEESSSVPESSTEESSVPESSTEESSSVPESSTEESSSVPESSTEESSSVPESSVPEESSSVVETSVPEESSSEVYSTEETSEEESTEIISTEETPEESSGEESTTAVSPTTPDSGGTGSTIPQTGSNWWSVLLLTAAGLFFILMGLLRRER